MKKAIIFACTALSLTIAAPAFARPMTETDLATMKRLGSPTASPDGKIIAYQLQETDLPANKRRTDIYVAWRGVTSDAGIKVASAAGTNEHSPAFSSDGKFLYFLSNKSGSDQLYRIGIGSGPTVVDPTSEQLSDFKTDVAGFKLSPDGKKVAIWGDIARDCSDFGCDKDGDTSKPGPGTGREYDALLVRHWDSWETTGNYSRTFSFDIAADGKLTGGKAMDADLIGDAPSKPMGGGEEIAWAADSKSLFYALRLADKNEATSTNLDIYHADVATGAVHNATPKNTATDTLPSPSPDGKYLAYAAMARPGYEADRQVLMLRELATGTVKPLTEKWDRSVDSIAWAPDSKALYVTAQDTLDHPIFKIDLKGKVTRLTDAGTANDVIPFKDGGLL
ncbi:MAG: S9 family peptidase, partial [Sphingorhabdus sp.]